MKSIQALLNLNPKNARLADEFIEGGRREGENENPYLSGRRSWNDHMESVAASRNMWQILAILSLMITLAGAFKQTTPKSHRIFFNTTADVALNQIRASQF